MKEKWNALEEKWYALKETKGFRIFSTIVGLISILGPSVFALFHEEEEPTPMEEASMLMEDEVRMDAIMDYSQRAITVNGSTVEIYLSAAEDADYTGAAGLVVAVTQNEVLVATVYDAVKGQESVGVCFFDQDWEEGRILAAEEALNIAILTVSKADTESIIVPAISDESIKKGTSLYGYNRGAAEESYSKTVEVTDAKFEVSVSEDEEIKCIEIQLTEDDGVLNRIFYTEDGHAVGMSVPGVAEEPENGCAYIVPVNKILQIAGVASER